MKYLKIEDNRAFFFSNKHNSPNDWTELDKIEKDDLIYLLDRAIYDDFEMDTYDEAILANKAHQIIYKNLHDRFSTLMSNKSRFHDETQKIYKDAIEKYQ